MNILIVTTNFPSNVTGSMAAKFVYLEAKGYAANGANVRVVTPIYPGAPAYEKFDDKIEVERFSYFIPKGAQQLASPMLPIYSKRAWYYYLTVPFFLASFFFAVLKRARWADIILCEWSISYLFAFVPKLIFGKPALIFPRGSDIRLFPAFVNRFIFKSCTAVIDIYGPSKWSNDFKKRFAARYIQLPCIIERETRVNTPADLDPAIINNASIFKIMYVGRFDDVKLKLMGLPILDLIEAAKILREKNFPFHIFYIGDGETGLVDTMKEKIKEYGLGNQVTMLGYKKNVEDYIRFANLGIGGVAFNTVSQELSLLNIPQILAINFHNDETPWTDKENALFFEPGNTVSLTDALEYAMNDKDRLNALATRGNELMQKYVKDLQPGGAAHLAVFKQLIQSS